MNETVLSFALRVTYIADVAVAVRLQFVSDS